MDRKRAFVVRPFGKQENVDFDRIHKLLIGPAIAAAHLDGDTTAEIVSAGNIRTDMFRLLATADVVIADLSIHNANVFYELGVRHALRSKRTFLIRAKLPKAKDVPFDLKTDRYLAYDPKDPAKSVAALADGLRKTLDSDVTDSPVLGLLQIEDGIIPSDLARLLAVPGDFGEEVTRAKREGRVGDLALLGEEATLLSWVREGLRRVGNAQFDLSSLEPARPTWERLRGMEPKDVEANSRLATIYQKLKQYSLSEEAIDRVIGEARGRDRAELGALRASNIKTDWVAEWEKIEDAGARERVALQSARLYKAVNEYSAAFEADRNHFYSGLNALAMRTMLLGLIDRQPEVWLGRYATADDAAHKRRHYQKKRDELATGVKLALDSAERAAVFLGAKDRWLDISKADHELLSGGAPQHVAVKYRDALTGAEGFYFRSARAQVELLQRLGVCADACKAALAVMNELMAALPPEQERAKGPARVLVFTGHRMDAPGRKKPRFARTAKAEKTARRLIEEAVRQECDEAGPGATVIGLAGGASGGDILFHEICAQRGIATEMYIVGSREAYLAASVQDGGPGWVQRFSSLADTLPVRTLGNAQDALELPRWLRPAKNYSIWERSNRWMLHNALVYPKVTLIALWNGEQGDGPGGTESMVATAKQRGATVRILNARLLAK
jgi:tetratricopeptide (TPR) repeat protein